MVDKLAQTGFDSFSTLYTSPASSGSGEETVTNENIANDTATPAIDGSIYSQPYNFMLGTPGGANDPSAILDASNDVYALDNGDPEFSPSIASVFASLGADGSTNPANLDPSVFAAWTQIQQQIYLQSWGLTQAAIGTNVDGGANGLYVSLSSSGAVSATSLSAWADSKAAAMDAALSPNYLSIYAGLFAGDQNVSQSTAENDLSTSPADLDPSVFRSWTSSAQAAYVQYWANSSSNAFVIGLDVDDGADAILVTPGSGMTIASSTSFTSWTLSQGEALNASGQAAQTIPTSTAPSDLNGYGGVSPAELESSVFEQWTSEQQAEYMRYQGVTTAVIGSGVNGSAGAITAVLSSTLPNTVYIVQNLQASDLASMSSADIAAVTATAAWQGPNGVGQALGFDSQDSASGQTPLQVAEDGINSAIAGIEGSTTPEYFLIQDLQVPNPETTTNYTAAQVAAGDVVVPTQSSVTQDSSGDTTLTCVSASGNVTTVEQLNVNSATKNGTYNFYQYTKNSDGSISVVQQTGTASGSASVSSTNPGDPKSAFSVYASVTPQADGSGAAISVTYNPSANGVILSTTDTSAMLNPVTVTNAAGDSITVDNMPAADRQVFIDELQLLGQQIQAAGVVNQTQVASEIQQIMSRFTQAAIYWSQFNPNTYTLGANGGLGGAVSTDGGASIQQAYTTFIAQEKVILQAAQNAEALSSAASANSPDLDAPTAAMIALGSSMSAQQANIEIGTTQLQQIQSLLQNLGSLQNLVNTTLTSLNGDTSNPVAIGGFNDGSVTPSTDLTASQLAVVQMFSSNIAGQNPILTQYGITLPQMELIRPDGSMPGYTSSQWTTYGQSLSNLVTELQQQAQTLTTELNQETQQMNNTYTEMTGIAGQMATVINTIGTNMD